MTRVRKPWGMAPGMMRCAVRSLAHYQRNRDRLPLGESVRIWSNEHRAYWRPKGYGYTTERQEAGQWVSQDAYSADRAHALVDYVFGRPAGEAAQEVGGVMVTLAALCLAHGLDMHEAGEVELARILQPDIIAKIRAKQASKPTGSALPVAVVHFDCEECLMADPAWCMKAGHCRHRDGDAPGVTLTDGSPVTADHREIDPRTGMQKGYVVLSAEERAKGFVRPVRRSYIHEKCGVLTTMSQSLAETYARDPFFYSGTFCAGCRDHFPVGEDGEFLWDGTNERVGA